ncbi:MAG: hypothetical protein NVS4B9_01560 [Ktedonobacteraceae bacterium]
MDKNTHEYLLQTLSALLIEIHALKTLVPATYAAPAPPAPAGEPASEIVDVNAVGAGLKDLEELAGHALAAVRASLEEIPLPELEGVSLADALSRMVEDAAERLNLTSRISFSGLDEQNRAREQNLSTLAEHLLYLVAREGLYQVEQHTGARRLRFTLNYNQDDVQMSLEDDGINPLVNGSGSSSDNSGDETAAAPAPPFESGPAAAESSLIPIINDLRARLKQLGGSLKITSPGERGTSVSVRIPYISAQQGKASTSVDQPEGGIASREVSPKSAVASIEVGATVSVRILVVDSQAVTRAGLHRLLESYPGLQVIGEAADGVQAVSETLELGPQVVVMDTQLPNGQSLEALRQIKQLNLDTKVLLLAAQSREEYMYETLRAGADGYVLKDIAPDELARAILAVARGEVLVQPQLAGRLLSRFGRQGRYDTLTARELDVLRLLARGLRNKEIAARLYVSERTVNFHLANIYQKLNVSGRTEALSKAIEQGLVST